VHPAAAGQTFLVSDGEDLSTTDLLRRTALTMGIKPVLLPVPVFLLEFGGALLGKRALVKRLCGSLQIDIKKTQLLLDWTPPLTVEQGLKKAIESTKQ
jgi:nucleoside-diphosphate-sugar epimerase